MQKQLSTIMVVLTMLIFSVLSLVAMLGCEEQPAESNPVTVNNSTVPDAVTIGTINIVSDVTINSISISWTEPKNKGKNADGTAASITGYKVYYKVGDTATVIDENLLNKDNKTKGIQTTTTAIISELQ